MEGRDNDECEMCEEGSSKRENRKEEEKTQNLNTTENNEENEPIGIRKDGRRIHQWM